MDVSENSGFYPQIIHLLIGFSIIDHPFWGTTIFGNTHIPNILRALLLYPISALISNLMIFHLEKVGNVRRL